jgi:hypothetical protein
MPQFIRIGDSLINLAAIRAVEYAGDGRLQIFLSEDRHGGLVMRYSGAEAEQAWATLCDPNVISLIGVGDDSAPADGLRT